MDVDLTKTHQVLMQIMTQCRLKSFGPKVFLEPIIHIRDMPDLALNKIQVSLNAKLIGGL